MHFLILFPVKIIFSLRFDLFNMILLQFSIMQYYLLFLVIKYLCISVFFRPLILIITLSLILLLSLILYILLSFLSLLSFMFSLTILFTLNNSIVYIKII